ncbi:MAG: hypothetical protein JWO63_3171 [Frankiales bacterium]|nr:hypothetical protein [Frankiales bacterium]
MAEQRYLDPRHGPHEPTTGTPPRRPGSIRRTSTVDSLRTMAGDRRLALHGRARDLLTRADGTTEVAATARTLVEIAYTAGPIVQRVETEPPVSGLAGLTGRLASTGFRAAIDEETSASRGTLEYLLLDEIPVATLVSGYSVMHATSRGDLESQILEGMRAPGPPAHGPDMCAGFQVGGTIMQSLSIGQHALVTGPEATPVLDPADPIGWHEFPGPLPTDGMRRWRRADLWAEESDGLLHLETFFRDSHLAPDGFETIIHEYTVSASIDPLEMRVVTCSAQPRVLPFVECPQAADSGRRLEGMLVGGLRKQVRAELTGTGTCTHLNDQLRELEDAASLVRLLPSPAPTG